MNIQPTKEMPAPERFHSGYTVDQSSGCWLWHRSKRAGGYGQIKVNGQIIAAHRFSWVLRHGGIPDKLFVCHSCDTPACVNPDHLFLGTARDNSVDMYSKGRKPGWIPPMQRLTAEDVIRIREAKQCGASSASLAQTYGVNVSHVNKIIRRAIWKQI